MGKLRNLRGMACGIDIDGTDRRERTEADAELEALKHDIARAQDRNTALLRREAEALSDLDLLLKAIGRYRAGINAAGHHETVGPCMCSQGVLMGKQIDEAERLTQEMCASADHLDLILAMIKSRQR